MMDPVEYLTTRLEDQIQWYNKKSQINQRYYKLIRVIEILCAAVIPFISGIAAEVFFGNEIVGILGITVATCVGVGGVYRFQENWTEYRLTAERLQQERVLFLTGSPPYVSSAAFSTLVIRCEEIMSSETGRWQENVQSSDSGNTPLPNHTAD